MKRSVFSFFFMVGCVSNPRAGIPLGPVDATALATSKEISPIDRDRDGAPKEKVSGDAFEFPHDILWNKDDFIRRLPGGKLPAAGESYDVVIVGGGMSGLLSARALKEHRVLLLEQASRLGGNSKGEAWRGLEYSIGAAYITVPKPGGPIDRLLNEIGLRDRMAVRDAEDEPFYLDGKSISRVWDRGTRRGNRAQFNRLRDYFTDLLEERRGLRLPEIPPTTESDRRLVEDFDQLSFKAHLEKVLGESLDPDIEAIVDRYCWSALDGRIDEISAAAGLNFFVGDFENSLVAPGGNSSIAEGLARVAKAAIRVNSLVFHVEVLEDGGGADVSYARPDGQVFTVRAKSVVFAAPKFIAAKVIHGLEPERLKAISELKYRSYLVGNILLPKRNFLDKKGKPRFYEAFFVSRSKSQPDAVGEITDVTYGNFAHPDKNRIVLTAYWPLPVDGMRMKLLPMDFSQLEKEFVEQIRGRIFPSLGLAARTPFELRVSRWGHPLPLAATGVYTRKQESGGKALVDILNEPFRDVVFFANQDNWALPGFESVFATAEKTGADVQRRLKVLPAGRSASR